MMLVQRVVAPVSGTVSWTVVDESFEVVAPAEAYLAHLEAIERSPNTVRAYASSLRLFFEHLERRGVPWDTVGLDEVLDLAAGVEEERPAVPVFGSLTDLAAPGRLAAIEQ